MSILPLISISVLSVEGPPEVLGGAFQPGSGRYYPRLLGSPRTTGLLYIISTGVPATQQEPGPGVYHRQRTPAPRPPAAVRSPSLGCRMTSKSGTDAMYRSELGRRRPITADVRLLVCTAKAATLCAEVIFVLALFRAQRGSQEGV